MQDKLPSIDSQPPSEAGHSHSPFDKTPPVIPSTIATAGAALVLSSQNSTSSSEGFHESGGDDETNANMSLLNRATHIARQVYGYALVSTGTVLTWLEQSPFNEQLKIDAGLEALKETGDPQEVGKVVTFVSVPIEIVPAAVIIVAGHSNNPVVQKPRNVVQRWKDMGDKRAEYRKEVKTELKARKKEAKFEAKNNKQISKGKEPILEEDTFSYRASQFIEKVKDKLPATPKFVTKELTDLGLALGLGAGIVVLKNILLNKSTSVKDSIKTAIKATTEIAIVNGLIGYFIAGGTNKAKVGIPLTDYTLHYERQAQILIDYGTDTKWLMGVLAIVFAPSALKKLWHRMPKREKEFQNWLACQKEIEQVTT